jgi:hypothetical protein
MSSTLAATRLNTCRVLHAIRSGKISAPRSTHGHESVTPAAPRRVYPAFARTDAVPPGPPDDAVDVATQLAGLKQVAEILRAQLEAMRQDRDAWRDEVQRLASADQRTRTV